MRKLFTFAWVLFSLALPIGVLAEPGEPRDYPRCVNDPPKGESLGEVEKETQDAERPLHQTAVKLIKDYVCKGADWCWDKHGDRLTRAAHAIVDVCLSEPGIPKYMCLGFVANIANEGGGLEHPSCGGLDPECIQRCDEIQSNGGRRDCFMQCALEEGVPRSRAKGSKWQRIWGCNDGGTSRGPFQMKKGRIKQCQNELGPDFDPFDLEQSARCMMKITRKVATAKHFPCGKVDNRWLVAHKRVTGGVLRTVARAKPGRWIPDLHGGQVWVEPTRAIREPICSESPYGQRGLRYYRACGERCREVRPAPETQDVALEGQ